MQIIFRNKKRTQLWIFIFSIGIVMLAAMLPPASQPDTYHHFADQRIYWGVPNFLNVVSNLGFLLIGVIGVVFIQHSFGSDRYQSFVIKAERWPYLILFFSVVMTCFGSAYYHLVPDNERLLWDRLPIACGVTALLAATIVERVSIKSGLILTPILVLFGLASVLYWYWSELQGVENLNFYIVAQFYSLLLVIVLSMIFPSRYTRGADIFIVVVLYGVAKVAEMLDDQIYTLGHIVSGHTLKHLLATVAVYWILRMLIKRVPVSKGENHLK